MFVENPDSWDLLIFILSKLPAANLSCPDLFVDLHPYSSLSAFAEILHAVDEPSSVWQVRLGHKSTATKVLKWFYIFHIYGGSSLLVWI